MAIEKHTDMGNGTSGNYWALLAVSKLTPGGSDTAIEAEFGLWVDEPAYAAGVHPLRRLRRIRITVPGSDPKLSEISAAVEVDLLRPAVQAVAAVQAQPAKAAVAAAAGRPAVAAQSAVAEVVGVVGVVGGKLDGGTRR